MDWSWVYGSLIRATGWTFEQCEQQPCDRVFEFLNHLSLYPPEHVILAAVYGMKPVPQPARRTLHDLDLNEAATVLGAAGPVPEHLMAMFASAEANFAGKR